MEAKLKALKASLKGDLLYDKTTRILYATDASVYREMPIAVAVPREVDDLKKLITFAKENRLSLIPRAAGTSLAGQVVGAGIVVDISKYFTEIIALNTEEKWVKVQPGVIRDELNRFLRPHNLYFGPETSTANRATIGGMVGNNSCGANSLLYKSTREHTLEIEALLSDGSQVTFSALSPAEVDNKCELRTLEGALYRHIRGLLDDPTNQREIRREFPKRSIDRRNTGYAIDLLLDSDPFTPGGDTFNFCKLLCGSEGTLAFVTSIKLQLVEVPTKPSGLLCIHFHSIEEALLANLVALKHRPLVSELMDRYILECTKNNLEQAQNRFFIEGDPAAVLVVEYDGADHTEIIGKVRRVEQEMREQRLGYHFPLVVGDDKKKVWSLRKAGLGLLTNTPGDAKPVAVIEDTAVAVEDLPEYIKEFNSILARYGLYSVHYAHAATGELHLRPVLNLKDKKGKDQFRIVATEIAKLVKKYQGSLSGEHGDGRLRGEFIRFMVGSHNYALLEDIKKTWDPHGVFNPGKIVGTPSMDTFLRYDGVQRNESIPTVFRYNGQHILQHVEQCNGSGDCRKTAAAGGTMCPSYMATRNEQDTTRARANVLREILSTSTKANPFDHDEIKEVMDLCLSCKGCKSECPSSVDMAKLKAEFLQGYYDARGVPFRSWMIGHVDRLTELVSNFSPLYNWSISNPLVGKGIKRMLGFAERRQLPKIANQTLFSWFRQRSKPSRGGGLSRPVYFFFDEFTNFNDVEIGKKAILLLEGLGYEVRAVKHRSSGRALISKGFLRKAKRIANEQVETFAPIVESGLSLVGVEPSAILTFRDEYVDLVDDHLVEQAKRVGKRALTIEEFIFEEIMSGAIDTDRFSDAKAEILLHTHCQQKAWGIQDKVAFVLQFLRNREVHVIPSGCCGMAGSFGYEREHYALSQDIGELVLFPYVRTKKEQVMVVAPGTSCRHQILEGTMERAFHPIEILYEALLK